MDREMAGLYRRQGPSSSDTGTTTQAPPPPPPSSSSDTTTSPTTTSQSTTTSDTTTGITTSNTGTTSVSTTQSTTATNATTAATTQPTTAAPTNTSTSGTTTTPSVVLGTTTSNGVVVTYTSTMFTSPSASSAPSAPQSLGTGAIAAIGVVAGLAALALIGLIATTVIRRRRASKFDREIAEAAAAAQIQGASVAPFDYDDESPQSAGYHDGASSEPHNMYGQQPMDHLYDDPYAKYGHPQGGEAYDMRDLGQQAGPYGAAAGGVAALGAAGAYAYPQQSRPETPGVAGYGAIGRQNSTAGGGGYGANQGGYENNYMRNTGPNAQGMVPQPGTTDAYGRGYDPYTIPGAQAGAASLTAAGAAAASNHDHNNNDAYGGTEDYPLPNPFASRTSADSGSSDGLHERVASPYADLVAAAALPGPQQASSSPPLPSAAPKADPEAGPRFGGPYLNQEASASQGSLQDEEDYTSRRVLKVANE